MKNRDEHTLLNVCANEFLLQKRNLLRRVLGDTRDLDALRERLSFLTSRHDPSNIIKMGKGYLVFQKQRN